MKKERKGKDLFSLSQKKRRKERICFLYHKRKEERKRKDLFSLSQKKRKEERNKR